MDREDSAIVHHRLESHSNVTFESEIDRYKSIRKMLEVGESEYSAVLKTRNLLIFRNAKNAKNGKIAPNWNVSGTRDFSFVQPLQLRGTLTPNEIPDKLGHLATA